MKMLKNKRSLFVTAFFMTIALCASVSGGEASGAEPVVDKSSPAEPNMEDVWASIESTIQTMADPFIPKYLKEEAETVTPAPVEAPPPSPPPVEQPVTMPFLQPVELLPEVPLPVLVVSGVIYDTAVPMAVINSRVYAVGETLPTGDGDSGIVRLTAVHPESIEVDFMGKTHTIPLEGK
jgi:hypothetical protein